MKKTLALVLAFALVFSSFASVFATEPTTTTALSTDATACSTLGMLVGDGNGVTAEYVATEPTKIQAAVMMLRLKGLEAEAKAFTGEANFADADKAEWAKPIMGYLKAHSELGWIGDGTNFNPTEKVTAKMYYKVLLESLGYKQNTTNVVGDFTWDNVIEFAGKNGLAKVATATTFTVDNLATATVEALKANVKDTTKTLAATLVAAGKIDAAKATTAGVLPTNATKATATVATAKSFKVAFDGAVADTAKVVFTVKRLTTPVTMTATWNDAKTEATLSSSANLPEGAYTVDIKNDATDLGSSTVTITAQKVAKITITSKNLSVVTNGNNQFGYASYKVEDQYGVDITKLALAANIDFRCGVGTITKPSKGLLKITPANSVNLAQFTTITILGTDSASAQVTSATLNVSTSLGTISDIQLVAIKNANNKVLTGGDTINKFYIDYVAKDMSGDETKDINLLQAGLILSNNSLMVPSTYITAKVVADPADSSKAVIEVQATNTSINIPMDLTIPVAVNTLTGKTSTLNVTLKKPAQVDVFTLMAPTYDIAAGETKEIPFVAYDQNGNEVKKYGELSKVALTGGATFEENIDGTARVMFKAPNVDGAQIITALTPTAKLSSLTVNVQKAAYPTALEVDSSVVIPYMQKTAAQVMDAGYLYGGFSVLDQYNRNYDMVGAANGYYVIATSDANIITASQTKVSGSAKVVLTASGQGTTSVTFTLKNAKDEYVDSKTVTFSVVEDNDITGYIMDTVDDAIYAGTVDLQNPTDKEVAYETYPAVYGTLSSGAKVVLGGSPIVGIGVDNTEEFAVLAPAPLGYDCIEVIAKKLPSTKTEASTNLTVTILGADKKYHSLTTPIKSTSVAPIAKSINVSVNTTKTGISKDGDTITLDLAANPALLTNLNMAVNSTLARYDVNGASAARAGININAKDQYATRALKLSAFYREATSTVSTTGFNIDSTGKITALDTSAINNGEFVVITAVTTNGLQKTIKIVFKK